jgi:hypothetical protein
MREVVLHLAHDGYALVLAAGQGRKLRSAFLDDNDRDPGASRELHSYLLASDGKY